MRPIKKGSTDQSVVIRIIDSSDGTPETGVDYDTSGIDLWYRREGATKTSITEVALASLDAAHSDGGIEHIGDGYYRLDLPDAAVATGANGVMVGGTVTGMIVIGCYVPLVDYDPYSSNLGVSVSSVVAGVTLADDAITSAKFDESTAFPLKSNDSGATEVARTGADGDTLEDISDQLDAVPTASEIQTEMEENGASILDTLQDRLTAARAGYLDELAAANIPADIDGIKERTDNLPDDPADDSNIDSQLQTIIGYLDTEIDSIISTLSTIAGYVDELESRLTAARAGYLDNLSSGAVALASVCTEARLTELAAANIPADIDTLLSRLTSTRASYLDNISGAPPGVKKNAALNDFTFYMVLSSDHVTGATGKTITAQISKDGAAFGSCSNSVSEISNGFYKINLTANEMNADVIALKFTETDCDQRSIFIKTSA